MATSIHDLETEVLSLSQDDRARLLERLLDSFEPSSELEDSWVAEALHRESEVSAGTVTLVPGEEAVARVRARIS